jgi:glycosyltransferase involved in cell wall biosynthesis
MEGEPSSPVRCEHAEGRTKSPDIGVCMVTETYFPVIGGGETQARMLVQDLVRTGYVVTLVTRRSNAKFPPAEAMDGASVVRLWPTGSGRSKKWVMLLSSLWFFVCQRQRFDVLLVSGFRVLGISAVLAAKLTGKKCVLKADNNGEMSGDYFSRGIRMQRLQWAMAAIRAVLQVRNWLFRRADAFVALSTDIERELQAHGVKAAAIRRIPNGFDPARFTPCEDGAERSRLRASLGVADDHGVVMFTGRLLRSKGLPLLLSVWKELRERRCSLTLVIVGSGEGLVGSCEDEIREYVQRHGLNDSVFFTGSVRNVEDLLRCADFFVFPTEDEAFGISLIEAMACGLPVVATAVGGIKDIVVDGETGLLVPARDFAALHGAIARLLDHRELARRLGRQAARNVRERFSRDAVADQYDSMFRSLLRERVE